MENFEPKKLVANEINGGNKYRNRVDSPQAEAFNRLIEAILYAEENDLKITLSIDEKIGKVRTYDIYAQGVEAIFGSKIIKPHSLSATVTYIDDISGQTITSDFTTNNLKWKKPNDFSNDTATSDLFTIDYKILDNSTYFTIVGFIFGKVVSWANVKIETDEQILKGEVFELVENSGGSNVVETPTMWLHKVHIYWNNSIAIIYDIFVSIISSDSTPINTLELLKANVSKIMAGTFAKVAGQTESGAIYSADIYNDKVRFMYTYNDGNFASYSSFTLNPKDIMEGDPIAYTDTVVQL